MKNKGMVLIETLVSITLFFIVVFPLLGFNQQLLHTNKKLALMKLEHKNYQALRKQLSAKDYNNLSQYIGKHEFTYTDFIEGNGFVGIVLPEERSNTTGNNKITIEITPLYIYSSFEKYRYLSIELIYETEVKTFSSEFISSGFEVYK